MTVEPCFVGQSYLPGSNDRISHINQYLKENFLDRVLIEVDGGIKLHNFNSVLEAGADIIVAGSEIFRADDPIEKIKNFYLAVN